MGLAQPKVFLFRGFGERDFYGVVEGEGRGCARVNSCVKGGLPLVQSLFSFCFVEEEFCLDENLVGCGGE